jgi:CRISPR-associated protein Cas1
MTFQNLIITQPTRLNFANNCIVISQESEQNISIPLSNINIILLDHYQISISSILMRECIQNNVPIICCDDKHLPNGIMHGYNTHHQSSRILEMQIDLSVPLKKQIWKIIVANKILSQAFNLKNIGSKKYLQLLHCIDNIKSGDTGNIEAITAKIYFAEMYENFRRFDSDKTNIMLNYGYSILRSTIAKYLVVSGLNPALGVFHHNQFNNFNLADDIIEMFRYLVDTKVLAYYSEDQNANLTKNDKLFLFEIFKERVLFKNGSFILINAIEKVIQSFQRVVKTKDIKELEMPMHKIDKSPI